MRLSGLSGSQDLNLVPSLFLKTMLVFCHACRLKIVIECGMDQLYEFHLSLSCPLFSIMEWFYQFSIHWELGPYIVSQHSLSLRYSVYTAEYLECLGMPYGPSFELYLRFLVGCKFPVGAAFIVWWPVKAAIDITFYILFVGKILHYLPQVFGWFWLKMYLSCCLGRIFGANALDFACKDSLHCLTASVPMIQSDRSFTLVVIDSWPGYAFQAWFMKPFHPTFKEVASGEWGTSKISPLLEYASHSMEKRFFVMLIMHTSQGHKSCVQEGTGIYNVLRSGKMSHSQGLNQIT